MFILLQPLIPSISFYDHIIYSMYCNLLPLNVKDRRLGMFWDSFPKA